MIIILFFVIVATSTIADDLSDGGCTNTIAIVVTTLKWIGNTRASIVVVHVDT